MLPSNQELLHLEYCAKKYDERNVPLYISYPTSSYWADTADTDRYVADLASVRNPFLYFHFPFCDNVCHYCMCYKVPGMSEDQRKRYVQTLIDEIVLKSSLCGGRFADTVTHLHWGGGTPTCCDVEDITKVFTAITDHFTIDVQGGGSISIEAYPSVTAVTRAKLALLRSLGFNEISFGIQDLDERVQQAINRSCRFEELATLVTLARAEGCKVHIDLCYGLPFQELGGFEKTMTSILSLKPDRVAMLTYVHYPLLYANQRRIPLAAVPNSFMRVMLYRLAEQVFSDAGYVKIGFDHFVRPDNSLNSAYVNNTVCRDLMGYSVGERKNFIGFGSSAISFLNNTFYHNAMTVDDYHAKMAGGRIPLFERTSCTLSKDDVIRNEIIQKGVLTYFQIDKRLIEGRYAISFDDYFSNELDRLSHFKHDGLVDLEDSAVIRITDTGRYFCRHIAAVFDRYYRTSGGKQ